MFYSYIQPILLELNKEKISATASETQTSWEQTAVLKIAEITRSIMETIKKKDDTLYLMIYPENTFKTPQKVPFTKEQVGNILSILSNSIESISNLVLIPGTIFWEDEDKKIYNSVIVIYQDKIKIWDELFPYLSEDKETLNLGRWMVEDLEKGIGNMNYIRADSDSKISFPITFEERGNNILLYGYKTPGTDGKQVVYIADKSESEEQNNKIKKELQQKMIKENILPYTLQGGLAGSTLSKRTPLFSLDIKNMPSIAIDINNDNTLGIAKYYEFAMQKESKSNIQVYIIMGGKDLFEDSIIKSSSIVIQCSTEGFCCKDYRKKPQDQICKEERKVQNDYLKNGIIYTPNPLLIV